MGTPALTLATVVAAAPQQICSSLGDELVILNLADDTYYGLNQVGATVWGLVQQPRSVAALRDAVLAEYEVEAARCEQDLLELLASLAAVGLIEVHDAATPPGPPAA
jgi:hypothetical protein